MFAIIPLFSFLYSYFYPQEYYHRAYYKGEWVFHKFIHEGILIRDASDLDSYQKQGIRIDDLRLVPADLLSHPYFNNYFSKGGALYRIYLHGNISHLGLNSLYNIHNIDFTGISDEILTSPSLKNFLKGKCVENCAFSGNISLIGLKEADFIIGLDLTRVPNPVLTSPFLENLLHCKTIKGFTLGGDISRLGLEKAETIEYLDLRKVESWVLTTTLKNLFKGRRICGLSLSGDISQLGLKDSIGDIQHLNFENVPSEIFKKEELKNLFKDRNIWGIKLCGDISELGLKESRNIDIIDLSDVPTEVFDSPQMKHFLKPNTGFHKTITFSGGVATLKKILPPCKLAALNLTLKFKLNEISPSQIKEFKEYCSSQYDIREMKYIIEGNGDLTQFDYPQYSFAFGNIDYYCQFLFNGVSFDPDPWFTNILYFKKYIYEEHKNNIPLPKKNSLPKASSPRSFSFLTKDIIEVIGRTLLQHPHPEIGKLDHDNFIKACSTQQCFFENLPQLTLKETLLNKYFVLKHHKASQKIFQTLFRLLEPGVKIESKEQWDDFMHRLQLIFAPFYNWEFTTKYYFNTANGQSLTDIPTNTETIEIFLLNPIFIDTKDIFKE